MKNKITFLFVVLASFISFSTANGQDVLQQKLPAITISDMDGNKVDISQLTAGGKIIILDFWATWCVPCRKELTNIMDVYDEWKEKYNCEIVAVSIDDSKNTSKVKPSVNGMGWDYKVLLDPNGDLKRSFGFQNVPYTLIADKDGNIVYQHSGYVDGDEFELEKKLQEMTGKN